MKPIYTVSQGLSRIMRNQGAAVTGPHASRCGLESTLLGP